MERCWLTSYLLFTRVARKIEPIVYFTMRDHMIITFCIRMLLIIYSGYHDRYNLVKYTDVDYRVFTDAARHVMNGESPYERHTYRYSPIIAWLLLPNIFLHECFGKILFSLCDILIAYVIKSFVEQQLYGKVNASTVGKYCSLFWLYNPFSIAISTRGNADSVSCLLIILSIYFLQGNRLPLKGNAQYFLSGIFLGIAIHVRLYPIVFTFPMYLSLGEYRINRNTPLRDGLRCLLIPNRKQLILAISTIAYFLICTYGMYLMYGNKFLFETYIYHLFRKDTRHNFSVFFYHAYLRLGDTSFDVLSFTSQIFVVLIMILLSLAYGSSAATLPFGLFCQAAVLVIYNNVVTSQYFLWFMSLFPLVVHDIKASGWDGLTFFLMWFISQFTWLVYAYFLEFMNQEIFIIIWLAGIFLFGSSIAVLNQIMYLYRPGYAFGIARTDVAVKNK